MAAIGGINGTGCNVRQYQLYLSSKDSLDPSITCLTHGQTIGLFVAAGAASLSLVSGIFIYIWIGWNVRWYRKNIPGNDWKLFQRPFDIYMSALLGFDILHAISGIFNFRWAQSGMATTGPICTAQGVFFQIGMVGVPLITLILTVHTFVTALWQVGSRARGVSFGLVGLVCIFTGLSIGISTGMHKNYVAPVPFWCWISPHYPGERIGLGYFFLWLALLASMLLYIPLYFWKENRLSVDEKKWYKLKFHTPKQCNLVEDPQRRVAWGMLLYPLAYTVIVLPLSIVRWSLFYHKYVPSAATLFVVSLYYLSGVVNILLLLIFRPHLLLLTRPERKASIRVWLKTEVIVGTSKTPQNSCAHSETPLCSLSLTDHVCIIAPQSPPSLPPLVSQSP